MEKVDIRVGIPEMWRDQAGAIFYEAFRRMLEPLVGVPARTQPLIAAGFELERMLGAVNEGRLVGLAGLHYGGRSFSTFPRQVWVRALGPVRGLWASFVLNQLHEPCPPDHLRIEALAVDAACRGLGAGSALLEASFDFARRQGFSAVRLEVVDTNINARRLYVRMGFEPVAVHRYPFIGDWLGFSGEEVMVKKL